MGTNAKTKPGADANEWYLRSQFWLTTTPEHQRLKRQRESIPLVLAGHGLSLRVDKGTLLVRDGNTHYPAEQRTWRYFKGSLDIPPSIIVIDGSGEITFDAVDWLAAQRVPLIRLRWDGRFASIITSGGQAADSALVRWQAETRDSPQARIDFSMEVIREKAKNTIETMETHIPRSKIWDSAMYGIQRRVGTLDDIRPRTVNEVLGFEGGIAADYFRAWCVVTLKWQATNRYPIPDDWRKFSSRSAVRLRQHSNSRATHPVNAMLNYAYGVLLARTQVQLIAEGYDPTIGIMHIASKEQGKTYPGFALDRMELMRPVVDRAILQVVGETTFTGADFAIQDDGTCRLNPELARRIARSIS